MAKRNVPKCKSCIWWFYGETANSMGKKFNYCRHPAHQNLTKMTKQDVVYSPMDCPIRLGWDDRLNGKFLMIGNRKNEGD